MSPAYRAARVLPLAAFLLAALGACRDDSMPTAPIKVPHIAAIISPVAQVNSLADPGDGICDVTQCTLREAINSAPSGATIRFSSGLTGTITLGSQLEIVFKNLTIHGPGASAVSLSGSSVRRVLWVAGSTVSIDSLTFTAGNTISDGTYHEGGAILLTHNSVVSLSQVTVSNSHAEDVGGGIALRTATLSLSQSTITGNSATHAGAIYSDGTLQITASSLTGNSSTGSGGAVSTNTAGTTTLTDCVVTGNSAGSSGGAMVVYNPLTVVRSTISGNSSVNQGGGIMSRVSAVILNSTISGNSSALNGGGVFNYSGLVRISHSTITGNTAPSGAGIFASDTVRVKGSIVWGNTTGSAANDVAVGNGNFITSLGHNLVGAGGSGVVLGSVFNQTGDQIGVADAKLGALALNTPGTTQTHALLAGSPAINAGVCTDITGATLATDQRGVSRPQGSACDIGAYELPVSGGTTPTFSFDLSTLPAKTFGDSRFSVAGYATTNSTGAITFATGAGSVGCTLSQDTVTITGAAVDPNACILVASLAADATYTTAGPLQQSFHIAKAPGSVAINNIPSTATAGGSFSPTYAQSGDGTAATVSNSTGVCTVTTGTVNFIAPGTCRLQASVTEGTNHLAATGSEQTFTVSGVTTTFDFDLSGLSEKAFGDGSFSVASYATTNSTGAVTFTTTSTVCSVTSGGMVTINGAAVDPVHCVIAASLAADGNYTAAGPIEQSFNIYKAPGAVTINNLPVAANIGDQFTPAYTKAGDGATSTFSYTTDVCTVTDGVVSFVAPGTCTLQASVAEGTDHMATSGSQQDVTVRAALGLFSSSCTYTLDPQKGPREAIVSWENAIPGVTLIEVIDGKDGRRYTRKIVPTASGSWHRPVKPGVPTYGMWGGSVKNDTGTNLVPAGTACTGV